MNETSSRDDDAAMVALLSSFQQVTQHADAKVATLVTVHAGLGAVVASRTEAAATVLRGSYRLAPVLIGVVAVLLASFLAAGLHLYQALRPRIPLVPGANRHAYGAVWPGDVGKGPAEARGVSSSGARGHAAQRRRGQASPAPGGDTRDAHGAGNHGSVPCRAADGRACHAEAHSVSRVDPGTQPRHDPGARVAPGSLARFRVQPRRGGLNEPRSRGESVT